MAINIILYKLIKSNENTNDSTKKFRIYNVKWNIVEA